MMGWQQGLAECARLAQSGQLDEAARRGRALFETHPDEPRVGLLLGTIEARRGRLDEASDLLIAALAQLPGDADGWFNLALVCQARQDWKGAEAAYRRSLEAAPAHVGARANLAHVLERAGQAEAAVAVLQEGMRLPSPRPELALALGALLIRNGRIDEALERLESLVESGQAPVEAWMHLGIARARSGDPENAVAAYDQVLARAPGHPHALLNRGKAQVARGRLSEAEQDLTAAAQGLPDSADAHASLAAVLSRRGRFEAADRHALRSIELAPDWSLAHFNRAALYSRRTRSEDLEVAEAAARRTLELAPGHAGARQCLAIVLDKLGRPTESLEQARAAVSAQPEQPEFAVTLGDLLSKSDRLEEAGQVFADARARTSEGRHLARQHGIVLLRQGRHAEALEALDRALALDPGDQRVIAHRAVALQWLGRHDEAEAYLGIHRHIHPVDFPVPDGFSDIGSFNRALAADIRGHSQLRWEPIGLAARNGALTDELLADRTPATLGFAASLRQSILSLRDTLVEDPDDPFLQWLPPDDFEVNIWATLCGEGGNIDTHIHEESWISGAYYVELPDLGRDERDPSGWIEFGRPHREIPFPEQGAIRLVRPQEGLLVLFPSYLFHRTVPHVGEGDRISVSFDLIRPT